MSYNMDGTVIFNILILFITTLSITLLGARKIKKNISKFYLIFMNFSVFVYSGIGLNYKEITYINTNYMPYYFIFIIIGTLTFVFVSNIKISNSYIKRKVDTNKKISISGLEKIFLLLFFSLYVVRLVYPEFRILDFFKPNLSIDDIFARREGLRSNSIWEIFRLINLAFFPIFLIVIKKLLYNGKKLKGISLFVLWVYCEFITLGYISRNEMLTYLVFIVIVLLSGRVSIKISKNTIFIIALIIVILLPSLLIFEYTRMGATLNDNSNYFNKALTLFYKETDYTKYYDFSLSIFDSSNIFEFIRWFFTLPIPRVIAGSLKENQLEINNYFTEKLTNIQYGAANYSVILPSILGESFIVFGQQLFWIHSIFIYSFLALLNKLLTTENEYELINLYFVVQVLTIGRGGVSGYVSYAVNTLFIYFIFKYFFRMLSNSNKQHSGRLLT